MKIALVHDHLAQDGGAEKVVQCFQEIWPEAPIFVVVHNPKKANNFFKKSDIRTSFIQKLPFGLKKYQWFFPLMPAAVESYNLEDYDVILSSTSSFAKGVITKPDVLHICYCHTPTRFLWSDTHDYIRELGVNRLIKKIVPIFLTQVRIWDKSAAERVDKFIANSKIVQERIKKYYHRDSDLIYPPVELDEFAIAEPQNYFLTGGRLVPYKRFDLVVKAFNRLGRPLKIFGSGPELANLKKIANKNIEFLGRVPEEEKKKLYSQAQAFINPQVEDFGITMLESMASGRPVIAYQQGGACEIVEPNKTGEFFQSQTWEDLADAIVKFESNKYNPQEIREYAQQFDKALFKDKIKKFVEDKYQGCN